MCDWLGNVCELCNFVECWVLGLVMEVVLVVFVLVGEFVVLL